MRWPLLVRKEKGCLCVVRHQVVRDEESVVEAVHLNAARQVRAGRGDRVDPDHSHRRVAVRGHRQPNPTAPRNFDSKNPERSS